MKHEKTNIESPAKYDSVGTHPNPVHLRPSEVVAVSIHDGEQKVTRVAMFSESLLQSIADSVLECGVAGNVQFMMWLGVRRTENGRFVLMESSELAATKEVKS